MSFMRTELRTMQNMCEGDNEKFLDSLTEIVTKRDDEVSRLRTMIVDLEDEVYELRNEVRGLERDLRAEEMKTEGCR